MNIKLPKTTGILTILSRKPSIKADQIMKVMPEEIRATVALYMEGKIQQWFMQADGSGVIFILNCKDVEEARDIIEDLPFSKESLVEEQFIPIGPLLPLGLLLGDKRPE
ncbi:hypothetical protein EHQ53_16205 [Leptospira langatensis]|uniref:Muconolactone isomerase domain-containing protein n=1 Tax=Leptospira langatensis TaxID=2484983 RepID=A0A5F1ZPW3_9LEPT|nr:hypothetical protein [Leptospira langatensis]TGK05187.1 hypothetical protein EHO57_00450 [Leptospira langatensis]TGL38323.1 hypothetical protein EHQ53_16205 [Leptospira langatensis]